MELLNLGSLLVAAVTTIMIFMMSGEGIPLTTPQGLMIWGTMIFVSGTLLELMNQRPRFLTLSVWWMGLIPIGIGLFQTGGILYFLVVIPLYLVASKLIDHHDMQHKNLKRGDDTLSGHHHGPVH